MSRRRPGAAYRLQLRPHLDFRRAAELAAYLRDLGVTHVHLSPALRAAPGSEHGYDVVDPRVPDPELGGAEGYRELSRALEGAGLGQILDIVPNHMAMAGPENPWWWDVLAHGRRSRFAGHFDVDWERRDPLLIPVLDTHAGRVVEEGRIQLEREGADFTVRFADHRYPVNPGALGGLLEAAAGELEEGKPHHQLRFLAHGLSTGRHHGVVLGYLEALLEEDPTAAAAVDRVVAEWNGSPDRLEDFLARQHYRLAWWRLSETDLGYRRFFHINELVALRTEDEEVFRDTHARVLEWLRNGAVDGVRVDHPDGLRDPEDYFRRLRWEAPEAWVVGEKILEPGERLREAWKVEGTTGYDFAHYAGGLFVDPEGEGPLTRLYQELVGEEALLAAVDGGGGQRAVDVRGGSPGAGTALDGNAYREAVHDAKLEAAHRLLGSDLNRLTDRFQEVVRGHRRHRDHKWVELRDALAETAAALPVYRTYVRAESGDLAPEDREAVDVAMEGAARRRPDLAPDPLDFLRALLLLEVRGPLEAELVMRFQQFTGPLMAKGVEDTALYRYHRLVSLNEVGDDPSAFGVSPEAFHRWARGIAERWPETLLSTSTHDTKRSEDVRARLHLLSEIPEAWGAAVRRWREMAAPHRTGPRLPDADTEYLLYQTLVGAWPIGEERLVGFLEKAAREASVHTTWTDPDPEYEEVLAAFARGVLADEAFLADFKAFLEPLVPAGRVNSLAQTLLRLTAPGVPDLYQGTELWDLSLVDPDNRRPVDFERRRDLLGELAGRPPSDSAEGAVATDAPDASPTPSPDVPPTSESPLPPGTALQPEEILARSDEGLPKLHVIRQALALRRERPELFGPHSTYRPLAARGEKAHHVVGFARGDGQREGAVVVVPRLVLRLGGDWGEGLRWQGHWANTHLDLPEGPWENVLTGKRVEGGDSLSTVDLLARFPMALLSRV